MRAHQTPAPLHVPANEGVLRYGDKNLVYDYYSRERLLSPKARAEWLDPDLRRLDAQSTVDV